MLISSGSSQSTVKLANANQQCMMMPNLPNRQLFDCQLRILKCAEGFFCSSPARRSETPQFLQAQI